MGADKEDQVRFPEKAPQKQHSVRLAVIAIIASTAVLAYLTWKYYGLNGALFIVILVTFASIRVLRTSQSRRK